MGKIDYEDVDTSTCSLFLALMEGDAVSVRIGNDHHAAGGKIVRAHHDGDIPGFNRGKGFIEIL